VSTGATDDLTKGDRYRRSMVTRSAWTQKLGWCPMKPSARRFCHAPGVDDWQPRHYGDATAGAIDAAVRQLIRRRVHDGRERFLP